MNKAKKIWLIVASSLIALGAILFVCVMSSLKWNFKDLSTVKYGTNEHTITETYTSISILTQTADVEILPANDENTSVVCFEQEYYKHEVSVKNGTLVIRVNDTRKLHNFIGFDFNSAKITLSVPYRTFESLNIEADTSDVKIPTDFTFNDINVKTTTGDVENHASATNLIKVKTSTGDICIKDATTKTLDLAVSTGKVTVSNVVCSEDVKIAVSTGRTNVSNLTCRDLSSTGDTGDLSLSNVIASGKLSIERDTGDVKFDGCDAAEIFVETDTGDVTGTLLSAKTFEVETDTGRVSVPTSSSGGKCKISTDTGDILISIL